MSPALTEINALVVRQRPLPQAHIAMWDISNTVVSLYKASRKAL